MIADFGFAKRLALPSAAPSVDVPHARCLQSCPAVFASAFLFAAPRSDVFANSPKPVAIRNNWEFMASHEIDS